MNMPVMCPPYQVGDSCLKVNHVVLLSRQSEDIFKTVIFYQLSSGLGLWVLRKH